MAESPLADLQAQHAKMTAMLILHAEALGYRVRKGHWLRNKAGNEEAGGHPRSLHMKALAIDLVVDTCDAQGLWTYCRDGKPYEELGLYWESLGGTWGGRFGDGGHFSLAHGGMK